MLKELRIQNFAVVENVSLTFRDGLNVLTGSTGAGKSLILSAVNLLRGERANVRVIRKGETRASVEAVFDLAAFGAQALPFTGLDGTSLVLRREIQSSGKSTAHINGKPSTVKQLSDVCRQLIESHGQNEQLRLKSPESHIAYLDMFAGLEARVREYRRALDALNDAGGRLKSFDKRMTLARERRELLEHRVEEVNRARLASGEKEELEKTLAVMEQSDAVREALEGLLELVYEGEGSSTECIGRARSLLARLKGIDDTVAEFIARLGDAEVALEECARGVRTYLEGMDLDPEKLAEMQERIALIQSMERRYKKPIDEILADKEAWQAQLEAIEDEAEARRKLEAEVDSKLSEVEKLARDLSKRRASAAGTFDGEMRKALEKLMMPGVEFKTSISRDRDEGSPLVIDGEPVPLHANGIDRVEFLICTNKGEEKGSVSEVASSGETSRIALALKEVLTTQQSSGVLIFDELDTGVGGDMGETIAKKLVALSRNYQILCITHMPQIAASAVRHLIVSKQIDGERTFVKVSEVDGETRLREIARMLGGSKGSEKRLALAAELLDRKKSIQRVRP